MPLGLSSKRVLQFLQLRREGAGKAGLSEDGTNPIAPPRLGKAGKGGKRCDSGIRHPPPHIFESCPSPHLQHQLSARQIPPFLTMRKLQQPGAEGGHLTLSLSLPGGGGRSLRQRTAGARGLVKF